MSKYGKSKYGKSKYGRYDLDVSTDKPLSQITRYRLRSVDSLKRISRPIVNTVVEFQAIHEIKIRLRSDAGPWVCAQSVSLAGDPRPIRIKSVYREQASSWTESVSATARAIN